MQAKVAFFSHGVKVFSAIFNATATSKNGWFNEANLLGSSYSDMEAAIKSVDFEGFQIVEDISNCEEGKGWAYISDKGYDGSCSWEASVKPAFFYSTAGGLDLAKSESLMRCLKWLLM